MFLEDLNERRRASGRKPLAPPQTDTVQVILGNVGRVEYSIDVVQTVGAGFLGALGVEAGKALVSFSGTRVSAKPIAWNGSGRLHWPHRGRGKASERRNRWTV